MRDWTAFVRARLPLDDLAPARASRIVREIAAQLEDLYRDAVAGGASDADADAAAQAHVGDWARFAADVRRADARHRLPLDARLAGRFDRSAPTARGRLMLAQALRDARFALRQLRHAPGFSIVAVLTVALAIGATTAMFSVVNGVLLRPLPYPEADRLARVHELLPQFGRFSVAPATFLDWRRQNHVFERLAAYGGTSATLVSDEGPERVQGLLATSDLFPLLRVAPLRGTWPGAEQDRPGAPPVVVLGYGLWQRRFGGDPAVVGRAVSMSGVPTTVLGVMPADFYFPNRTVEFWQPLAIDPAKATRGGHFLGVAGRLKSGVEMAQASGEMKAISERLAVQYPEASAGESALVVSLQENIVAAARPALLTLLAAVGLVVLIGCANVANLLLVRAAAREREVAIRAALGAGRGRLLLQMIVESLVLACAGGAVGIGWGYLALAPIRTLGAGSIPRVADVTLDVRVLAVAAVVSVLTGLIFGLAPAWQSGRARGGAALKEGSRSSTSAGSRWIRSGLLVAEVALSIVLLTGATLLIRSFAKLTDVDPGFHADDVLAFQVALPGVAYRGAAQQGAFFDRLLEAFAATPAIKSAALVQTLPLSGSYSLGFNVRGRAPADPAKQPSANYRIVSPRYFETMGMPIERGRAFGSQDTAQSQPVALVDRSFADRYFPGQDPIGQVLHIGNGSNKDEEIVGIVGNVRYESLDAVASPTMYVPATQDVFSGMWVLLRPSGDAASLTATARQTLRALDPALPIFAVTPLKTIVSESVGDRRFAALLLGLFAVLALFLAAVGLYGVVSYTVGQRTREIGLRMAIGASPRDILTMILGSGLRLTLAGIVLGIAASLALGRLVQALLFDMTATDPASYAATALMLLAVALTACYVPARRAMRINPVLALHGD